MKLIPIIILSFILLVPHTVMAADIHQKIEITIKPHGGNYTKMFNIVDANNSWLDNKHIWEGFRTDGRIIGEGIIPNPIQVNEYENDSGTAKMSIISVKYLDTYDIMSGTSDSYIRLPLAVNTTSYSQNITMRIKLYAIEGNTYNITDFNYTEVKYSTYASSYLLYSAAGKISTLTDIHKQEYSYPANITNLSLMLFYLHLRGPVIAKSTYILLQYLEIPSAKKSPFYILSTYTDTTGYYYTSGEIRSFQGAPTWSMLAKYGMSEDVYSFNIPDNKIYSVHEDRSLYLPQGKTLYVSVMFPAYSTTTTALTIKILIELSTSGAGIYFEENKTLVKGINNIFVNRSFYISQNSTVYGIKLSINSTKGENIYLYGARSAHSNIITDGGIYYHTTQMLFYGFLGVNEYISFQTYSFVGLQEPIIKYNVKYVYSLLDLPILIYKGEMYILTNAIYFLTFGHVDLRYLYSDDFIFNVVRGVKMFFQIVANSPIGLFIKTVIDFVVNSAAWWGNWLLQFGLFVLNIAAYALFLWPWIVLMRGLLALQEHGVDAMLDYFSSYVDRATSIMSKLLIRKGVG